MTDDSKEKNGKSAIAVALISALAAITVGYLEFNQGQDSSPNNPATPTDPPASSSTSRQFTGRVVDASDRIGISAAKVTLEAGSIPSVMITDNEGIFSFRLSDTPTPVRLRVEAEGYGSSDRIIEPSTNFSLEEIALSPNKAARSFSSDGAIKEPEDQIRINLSGEWIAEGYYCQDSNIPVPSEEVRIEQKSNQLIATKIKGDDCVRSGELTFKGSYDGRYPATIEVDMNVSNGPNSTERRLIPALLEVKSKDALELIYGGYKIVLDRKSS